MLDAHGFLGRQEQAVAVDRRLEADSLLADLAQRTEGKDLETAGVGEDRPIPAHEAVQAAMRSDDFEPGAQPEVEGVAEADLRSRRGQVAGRHCLDRSVGADRHEGRRVHCAVGESEAAATSSTVTGQKLEVHVIKGVSASSSRRPQKADSADVRRCTSSVSGNPSPSSGLPAKQKRAPLGARGARRLERSKRQPRLASPSCTAAYRWGSGLPADPGVYSLLMAAWAAASRAIGTRNGEQLT